MQIIILNNRTIDYILRLNVAKSCPNIRYEKVLTKTSLIINNKGVKLGHRFTRTSGYKSLLEYFVLNPTLGNILNLNIMKICSIKFSCHRDEMQKTTSYKRFDIYDS